VLGHFELTHSRREQAMSRLGRRSASVSNPPHLEGVTLFSDDIIRRTRYPKAWRGVVEPDQSNRPVMSAGHGKRSAGIPCYV
jgi:hypothetical protein